jgi:hypothetical protein
MAHMARAAHEVFFLKRRKVPEGQVSEQLEAQPRGA